MKNRHRTSARIRKETTADLRKYSNVSSMSGANDSLSKMEPIAEKPNKSNFAQSIRKSFENMSKKSPPSKQHTLKGPFLSMSESKWQNSIGVVDHEYQLEKEKNRLEKVSKVKQNVNALFNF